MVIVRAPQNVDVQRAAGRHGEGVEDVREHLRAEVADLFALDAEIGKAVWARADVDDCPRQSLITDVSV